MKSGNIKTKFIDFLKESKDSIEMTWAEISANIDNGSIKIILPKGDDGRNLNYYEEAIKRLAKNKADRYKKDPDNSFFRVILEPNEPESLIDYKEYVTGKYGYSLCLTYNKTIEVFYLNRSLKYVPLKELPKIPYQDTLDVEINIPSGKLIIGSYELFDNLYEEEITREDGGKYDWFDSMQGKKNFMDFYAEKNVIFWYKGAEDLFKIEPGKYLMARISSENDDYKKFITCEKHYSISTEKSMFFGDWEQVKKIADEKEFDLTSFKYSDGTKEKYISDLFLIDIKPGKYKFSFVINPKPVGEKYENYINFLTFEKV